MLFLPTVRDGFVPPASIVARVAGLVFGLYALGAAAIAALVFMSVGVFPFVVLPRGRREKYTIVTGAAWARFVARFIVLARPTVTGTAPDGPALFVSNHRSWLDPVLLIAYTRSQGLSKREILWIPFVGLGAYLTGAVFFDRSSPKARHRARGEVMAMVKQGARVHVYPEGTRTKDGRLGEHPKLVLVEDCFDAGLPVVPCAVNGTERAIPPTWPAAVPFQPCRLDILPALHPRDFPDKERFAAAVWGAVAAAAARG